MNILVLATAAEEGGAKTVLTSYYKKFVDDSKNQYYVCLGLLDFEDTDNIKTIKLDWTKKSGFHRWYFDTFYVAILLKRYKIDKVFSLNNTLPSTSKRVYLEMYLHQYIPFAQVKFSLFEHPKMWFKQNIVGYFIKKSIKRANKIIVQSLSFKQLLIESKVTDLDSIVVLSPEVNRAVLQKYTFKIPQDRHLFFFYPANDFVYKNHQTLFNAVVKLHQDGVRNFSVVLTLNGDEKIFNQYSIIKDYLVCLGSVGYEVVLEWYSKSVLVFPSFVETFGLPLLEAREIGAPIFAADTVFAHEILNSYLKVKFFEVFDSDKLKEYMLAYIEDFCSSLAARTLTKE